MPEARALLPRDVLLLAQIFPVLRQSEAVTTAPRRTFEIPDPQELRRRAFASLRELLARIGDQRPLVLAIDDLQWGDLDSATALADLLRAPDSPPLLFLGCYRSEDVETSPFLRALPEWRRQLGESVAWSNLAVGALAPAESRDLARTLLENEGYRTAGHAEVIARESGGNPFFITELVRHLRPDTGPADRPLAESGTSLDEMIWARILHLPEAARQLLKVVAVSGRPLSLDEACKAAGLEPEDRAAPAMLRAGRLIRGTGTEGGDEVETYHDRVREAVIAHLPPEALRDYHRRLARTLEASNRADFETLAVHYRCAGEPARAGELFNRAAEQAARALAFDRAAKLYRLALELRPKEGGGDQSLRVGLGDALANAGRGAEAAHAYQEAAAGADSAEVIELQRRAAYQFLISGHIDEGLAAFDLLLAQVGMWLSSTPRRALLRMLLYRTVLRCRGLGFRRRDASQVPPEELLRIDISRSVALGISVVDPIEGANWQAQASLRALRGGEPLRIALAPAWEAVHSACQGRAARRRTAQLIESADRLARGIGHPHAVGMVTLSAGCVELLEGRFRLALEGIDHGEAILREQCAGVIWELDTAHIFGLWTLVCLGWLRELRGRVQVLFTEAHERGDLYVEATTGTRIESLAWLAVDQAGDARARADEAVRHWSQQGFHIQHLNRLFAQLQVDLYAGDGAAAWRRLCEARPVIDASLLLRIEIVQIDVLHFSGLAAVAAAVVAADPRALLRAAEGYARRLDRKRVAWASAWALQIRAGAASVRGDAAGAVARLTAAVAAFDAVDMDLYAAAARRQLGGLLGGDEGRALIAQADAWMTGQEIRNPARMAASLAPGFPDR